MDMLRKMAKSKLFIIGMIGIVTIAGICLISPAIVVHDPMKADLAQRMTPPEWFSNGWGGHILGTDPLGRDVLTRMLIGGRFSLFIATTVVLVSTLIGTILGLAAGYFSKVTDSVIMRVCDIMMATPPLLLAICIVAVLGINFFNLIIVLVITSWVMGARVVRGTVMVIEDSEYVKAAKVLGSGHVRIMVEQILPNVVTPVIITSTQMFGGIVLTEAAMSFLGMGVPVPAPSWGTMISDGREYIASAPWVVLAPGILLMLTVLAFNFLGDGLRDVLDPKNKD